MMAKSIFESAIPFDTKSPNMGYASQYMQRLWEQLDFTDKSKLFKPESPITKTSKVIPKSSTSGEALGREPQVIAEDAFESDMYDSVRLHLKLSMHEHLALPKDALAARSKVDFDFSYLAHGSS